MSLPRLPTLEEDSWALRPSPFPIALLGPPVRRGVQVMVQFTICDPSPLGTVSPFTEDMPVLIVRTLDPAYYLGVLLAHPLCLDPDDPAHYLRIGAEVPLTPDHVLSTIGTYSEEQTRMVEESISRRWIPAHLPRQQQAPPRRPPAAGPEPGTVDPDR